MFRKVLIANRGEIAVRIIRTLREMGIASVAVYSDADRRALHVRMADEAAPIGPSPSSESYLRIDRILEAARAHGAEAIHPGYGFLSERAEFAAACEAGGIVFIGPPSSAIRAMGSKTEARRIAIAAGTPVVPGAASGSRDVGATRAFTEEHGFPIILKAVAGGGGKGMRRVDRESELESAFRDASSEAERAFGNGDVYAERFIVNPRHIEVQILADSHGHCVHLGERECSLQRRHQKILEECPSPLVAARSGLRERIGAAAVGAARAAGYVNAGTVEFLADNDSNFYFLEMNTRLQVEHPVTELVTGLDLVRLQVEIAAGGRLPFRQEDVTWKGAAIECRIYAEDPDNQFFPSPGRIETIGMPSGPGIRLDSGVYPGWTVPVDYDPLLAKLCVHAGTREQAIARMLRALDECHVTGIKVNTHFFKVLLEDSRVREGALHTGLVDEMLGLPGETPAPEAIQAAALAAAVHALSGGDNGAAPVARRDSRWRAEGREKLLR
jgi:acetyl-CoA carboxylase biotin carboxylase subunit